MLVMYFSWLYLKRARRSERGRTNQVPTTVREVGVSTAVASITTPLLSAQSTGVHWRFHDLVDTETVNLHRDEYEDNEEDIVDDEERKARLGGDKRWLWSLYYWLA